MLNASLHQASFLHEGDTFLAFGKPCISIARLQKGIMRGFIHDKDGNEVTTHFYQQGDMIIGSYLPKVKGTMTIQAVAACELSVADYAEVMSWVNKDQSITNIITYEFLKLNKQMQSRLLALLNLDALEKYEQFIKEYPGMINQIPHYYIAAYLGITPTQLSRVRKEFLNKCK